jgi:Fic family protein
MIYSEPDLKSEDRVVLEMIQSQRQRLRSSTQNAPRKWTGTLRKITFARAIQGSNSIEGYHSSIDEAVAAVNNEQPPDGPSEAWFAVNGYRQAMTCILQTAQDTSFEHSKQFLKALQFMMTSHDMAKANPGQLRQGTMYVVHSGTGETVYEAPDRDAVDGLLDELIAYLRQASPQSALVTAAMAHLNLTMIHPFSDGNGRMARALQTLVLALEGHFDPVFSSIEEWLGNHNTPYYQILSDVGQGKWRPEGDALPWVRFCLVAHHQQAARSIRRNQEYGQLYERIEAICQRDGLHDRVALPLFDVALGLSLTNTRYREATGESQITASRDLKTLASLGILKPKGQGRARQYTGGDELLKAREETRIRKPLADPYRELSQRA